MWSLTIDSFPKKIMAHHFELSKCTDEIATLVKTELLWNGMAIS